jgi:hypothetical protein
MRQYKYTLLSCISPKAAYPPGLRILSSRPGSLSLRAADPEEKKDLLTNIEPSTKPLWRHIVSAQ